MSESSKKQVAIIGSGNVQDVTLRDGMHAIRHQFTAEQVTVIAQALDAGGVDAIEVTRGDGLGGSSFNYGFGRAQDVEWFEAAASVLTKAKLTALLLPGIGTIHQLDRAIAAGIKSIRIATHCTEADVAREHIAHAREKGIDVGGFLMMAHMQPAGALAKQAKLMESYGAHCVYITDSAGALLLQEVAERVDAYREVLDDTTEVGIHAHHNLTLAAATRYGLDARTILVELGKRADDRWPGRHDSRCCVGSGSLRCSGETWLPSLS
jgi:4-hydroxy 2-oxovalerate aldolase